MNHPQSPNIAINLRHLNSYTWTFLLNWIWLRNLIKALSIIKSIRYLIGSLWLVVNLTTITLQSLTSLLYGIWMLKMSTLNWTNVTQSIITTGNGSVRCFCQADQLWYDNYNIITALVDDETLQQSIFLNETLAWSLDSMITKYVVPQLSDHEST